MRWERGRRNINLAQRQHRNPSFRSHLCPPLQGPPLTYVMVRGISRNCHQPPWPCWPTPPGRAPCPSRPRASPNPQLRRAGRWARSPCGSAPAGVSAGRHVAPNGAGPIPDGQGAEGADSCIGKGKRETQMDPPGLGASSASSLEPRGEKRLWEDAWCVEGGCLLHPHPLPHSRKTVLTCIGLRGNRSLSGSICRPGTPSCLGQSSSSTPSAGPLGQRS